MDPILHKAIIDGDEKTINEKFLGKEELLLEVTPFGNTILHVAAQYKQEQIAKIILQQIHDDHLPKDDEMITPNMINEARLTIKAESSSADDNLSQATSFISSLLYKQNSDGDTALHVAASVGCLDIIKHLLEAQDRLQFVGAGRSINMYLTKMINHKEDTVLHVAVRNGNLNVVKFVLEKDTELATQQNKVGESALFLAIERRYLDIAKHLLSETSDHAYGGRQGLNALHAAVLLFADYVSLPERKNLEDIITEIVERKSSLVIEKNNVLNWTPLHYASNSRLVPLDVVKDMLRPRDENYKNYMPLLEKDKNGMSALHIAAANGNTHILTYLILEFPLLCDLLNNHDQTVLHVAVESGQKNIVRRLLCDTVVKNSEAFLNKQDKDGNTTLHLAATWKERGILRILLGNENVNGNTVNNKGLTIYDLVVHMELEYIDYDSILWRNLQFVLMKLKSRMILPILNQPLTIMSMLRKRKNTIRGFERQLARIEAKMKFYEFETKSEVKQNVKDKETRVANIADDLERMKSELNQNVEDKENPVPNKADDLERKREEIRRNHVASKKTNTILIQELRKSIFDMLTTRKMAKTATENDMLIATIIATVTFAVAFQVPGGYESDHNYKGLPILRSRYSFKVFLISNCMAFGFSSCSILLHFLAAKRKGSEHSFRLLRRAMSSTFYSILTMVIAFISAIQLISTNSKALQVAPYICAASFFFFFVYDTLLICLLFICLFFLGFLFFLPLNILFITISTLVHSCRQVIQKVLLNERIKT